MSKKARNNPIDKTPIDKTPTDSRLTATRSGARPPVADSAPIATNQPIGSDGADAIDTNAHRRCHKCGQLATCNSTRGRQRFYKCPCGETWKCVVKYTRSIERN